MNSSSNCSPNYSARKPVLAMITEDWLAAGHKGEPPPKFVAEWREQNFEYGRWSLDTQFMSGSMMALKPENEELGYHELEFVTRPVAILERDIGRVRADLASYLAGEVPLPVGSLPGVMELTIERHREDLEMLEAALVERRKLTTKPKK